MFNEQPVQFGKQDKTLHGIYSPGDSSVAVLIVVGGPQYRVGSHRQFVKLSRALAHAGISNLRFDFAGMGDSEGELAPFYANEQAISLAIDELVNRNTSITSVVIWGLCDAASAALLYCFQHPDNRISGLVLLNPWVRQQQSHAQVMLKHYYWQRISSKTFWKKLLSGGLNPLQSLKELINTYIKSRNNKQQPCQINNPTPAETQQQLTSEDNYLQQMLAGWQTFAGRTLVITSGNDHTAREFIQLCENESAWADCLSSATHQHICLANHTFANSDWRGQVEKYSTDFVLKFMDTER